MAFEATQQLYQREAALINARAQQQYRRYISDLARQYAIAQENLNANLEGRGIYRSGEASTARTRLAAENQAMRSAALQDLQYQRNMNDLNLMKQLASLQGQSASVSQAPATAPPKFDDPNDPNDATGIPYFGKNEMNPAASMPKAPAKPATQPTAPRTVRPVTRTADQMERNLRRVSFAGR